MIILSLREVIKWLSIIFFLALLMIGALLDSAKAMNHGFDPNSPTTKWFERLRIPPENVVPCCGKSDSYPVDDYEKLPNGDYKVWIVDGSAITYPDGSRRVPWDTSIPVIVPKDRVNDLIDDVDNPTDHSWLFFQPKVKLGPNGVDKEPSTEFVGIYCFVRHPNGT